MGILKRASAHRRRRHDGQRFLEKGVCPTPANAGSDVAVPRGKLWLGKPWKKGMIYVACVLLGVWAGITWRRNNIVQLPSLKHETATPTLHNHDDNDAGTAFCIITKDDNPVLAEWVAYHYHVFRMRKLIVAEDPSSKTSTWDVLQLFTKEGSAGRFDLDVTVWQNDTFTPDWFRREPRDYARIPLTMPIPGLPPQNATHVRAADEIDGAPTWTAKQKRDNQVVNTHLARQKWLNYKCLQEIKRESTSSKIRWTAIIDTDEYIVPNPWVSAHVYENAPLVNPTDVNATGLAAIFPSTPTANALLSFFRHFLEQNQRQFERQGTPEKALTSRGCVLMPRIGFGGKEDDMQPALDTTTGIESHKSGLNTRTTTVTVWHHKRFETLRWKYHQNLTTPKTLHLSSGMKGILDVDRHELSKGEGFDPEHVPSIFPNIHRPSGRCHTCPGPNPWTIGNINQHLQPLALHHYAMSEERYMSRGDKRRNVAIYQQQNKDIVFAVGDTNHPAALQSPRQRAQQRWWIKGWLDSFVETHGAEAVYSIFGKDFATRLEEQS